MMVNLQKSILGKIPADWNISTIDAVSEKVTIGLVKTMTAHYTEKGVPLIRNSNIKENWIHRDTMVYLTEKFSNENQNKELKSGDVVTVHTGDIGTSAVIPKDLNGAQGFATLNTTVNKVIIYNEYLSWFFNSTYYKKQAYSLSTGDGRNNLNLKDFRKSLVCYPSSLKEQQKIAAILTSVDEAIEKTEQIIEQTERVKKGLMQELLTRGIGHTEFKDSPVGKRPSNWVVLKLDEFASLRREKYNPKTATIDEKYIGLEHIDQNTGRLLDYGSASDTLSIKNKFYKDDVLFGKLRPYLKKYWLCEFEGVCGTEILPIKHSIKIIPLYLYYLIQQDSFIDNLSSKSFGTRMPRTSWSDMKEYKFSLPPLDEQKRIVTFIRSYDDKLAIELIKISNLKMLKQGLMQQLLTGKKRVKVDDGEEVLS